MSLVEPKLEWEDNHEEEVKEVAMVGVRVPNLTD